MKSNYSRICYIFLVCTSLLSSGCATQRFLDESEVLFIKNEIELKSEEKVPRKGQLTKDLIGISQLQPNKKFIGLFKTRLWFYNVAQGKRETKFRYWMKNKIGEPPVLLDKGLAERSLPSMESYLVNKGYFYADVSYTTTIKRKKATVTYTVELNDLYKLDSVIFPQQNTRFDYIVQQNKKKTLLKSEDPFDVAVLKSERERISDDMRNRGYYLMNKEYVYFDLDSNDATKTMNVYVKVKTPDDSLGHQVFYMNQIYVYPGYSLEQIQRSVKLDTVTKGNYNFINSGKKVFKPEVLMRSIHFRSDDIYRKRDYQRTLRSLSELGVFKFINIKFRTKVKNGKKYLDAYVYLTPGKKQEVSAELEANNNTDYLLGITGRLIYLNKNLFKGAELFEFAVSSGIESNFQQGLNFFNTVDVSVSASIRLNKFLIPFKLKNLAKNTNPVTRISLKYNFLSRIDFYRINSTSISFGYSWRNKATMGHTFNPLVVSLITVPFRSDDFQKIIDESITLQNSFSEQFILGPEYIFNWSNQASHKGNSFFLYRGRMEMAGNVLHGITSLVNRNKGKNRPYEIANVEYAQFFRVEGDLRNYWEFHPKAKFVSRAYFGVGTPYGNSTNLPFVKQFFAGGSNGIRAWRVRTLGPGSFNLEESGLEIADGVFIDQTGELKLEGNLELRFDIVKFLKGALFVDAGNIWLLEADSVRPGAEFSARNFYKEIALGTGFGIRVDFSYFVLRFDIGVPLRDPGKDDPWVIKNFGLGKARRSDSITFNLAIGYPF